MVRSFTKFNFFVDSGRCALLCVFNESRPKIHAAVHWQNWTLQINKKKKSKFIITMAETYFTT